MPINERACKRLARVAFGLGAAEFALRAVIRTKSDWLCDFAPPYISSRLWLQGANPYDPFTALQAWYASGASPLANNGLMVAVYSVYPPPTLLLMAPLAMLRWQLAFALFVAIGLLLYAAAVYGLVRLGWPRHRSFSAVSRDPASLLFVAFALGFAPVHTAFHSTNIVLFACCAAILAILMAGRLTAPAQAPASNSPRRYSIGLLVGIAATVAICMKPTTGVFLLPWLVRERRWRLLAGVLLACAAITALSLAPLLAHQGLSWLPDYRSNVAALFTHGGNADVSAENSQNTDRIDLQLVAFAAFGNRSVASAVAAAAYIGLLLAFLFRAGWRKADLGEADLGKAAANPLDLPLLVGSGCLALGLLPSYSRMYAAVVLLPLVLWCFRHLRFRSARWLLLLLCDFLLNTSAIVRLIGEKAGWIARNPRLWDLTVGGHTCWLLLAIGCLLVYAARQQTEESALGPRELTP